MKKEIHIKYEFIEDFLLLSSIEQKLIHQAKFALKNAYAIYSGFFVGASLLLEDNKIIIGNNQENSSFPCGVCAERVALFNAQSNYPDLSIKKIAITANSKYFQLDDPVGPCGLCRQVLIEYEEKQNFDIEILMFNNKKMIKIARAKDLLPFYFKEQRLTKI